MLLALLRFWDVNRAVTEAAQKVSRSDGRHAERDHARSEVMSDSVVQYSPLPSDDLSRKLMRYRLDSKAAP